MQRSWCVLPGVVMLGMAGGAAWGQNGTGFTISKGDVFFTQVNSPLSGLVLANSGANFRVGGAAGTDNLYENWWWYRVNGTDVRELALANAAGTTTAAGTATTT